MLEIENSLWKEGFCSIAGLDEVGRGSLAGPILVSAVIIDSSKIHNLISKVNDSKLIKKSKHQELFYMISEIAEIGIGISSVEEIAEINILQANFLAMRRSVSGLNFDYLLIDGNQSPSFVELPKNINRFDDIEAFKSAIICNGNCPNSFVFSKKTFQDNNLNFCNNVKTIVKGDQKSISIASASICAKYLRDLVMSNFEFLSNQYGWLNNAGYGTKSHIEAIKLHGLSMYHRKNFCSKIISK